MKTHNKQNGMSMIGLLIGICFFGFIIYTGIRLGPIYSEYYSVVKAMKLVANKPGASNRTPNEIKDEMMRSFYTSYVERAKKKDIKIIRSRGKQLQVKYDVQEPFLGNIEFLIHFDKTMPLK
jgi:hypothetical protein